MSTTKLTPENGNVNAFTKNCDGCPIASVASLRQSFCPLYCPYKTQAEKELPPCNTCSIARSEYLKERVCSRYCHRKPETIFEPSSVTLLAKAAIKNFN